MSGGQSRFERKVKVAFRCGLPHGKFVKIACVKFIFKCPTINYRDRAAPVPENLSLQMSGGPGCFSCKVKAAIRCGLAHGEFVKIACVKIHLKCPTGGFYQSVGAGFHPRPQNFIFVDVGRTKPFRAQSESRVSVRAAARQIREDSLRKNSLEMPDRGILSIRRGGVPSPSAKFYLCRCREDQAVFLAK